ncbi:hypothetical protein [Chamaesiphon polymorphus]|uniref:Uncharacterized protein n=1 Tax=Chamaesiphon polymorphus CCALA 037 TaxID=2107692 RepID=A0A2T1GGF1_9CYAN|nr:hypothetical protein [Chamaesiphon polymorphus]PSB56678.1 hypothetical protein C7B77_11035 [Chamaesiphon polymorphus CCALA 037]
MKFIYLLPAVAVTLLQPTIATALSPAQIQSIAKSVTLKLEATGGGEKDYGSGVIIQKQGNNYIWLFITWYANLSFLTRNPYC